MSPVPLPGGGAFLVLVVGKTHLAVPVERVAETMRPLPIVPIHEAPRCVLGLAIVRGKPVPVIDAAALVDAAPTAPRSAGTGPDAAARTERFVVLRIDDRTAVLLVDGVLGLRSLASESLDALPSLVHAGDANHITSIGVLDGALLVVLGTTRLLTIVDAVAGAPGTNAASADATGTEPDAPEPPP